MIPLATTTITVWRIVDVTPSEGEDWPDPTDPVTREPVAEDVRAHISSPSGREDDASGAPREIVEFRLGCDPIVGGIKHDDVIVDGTTGEQFQVTWAHSRVGLGLDHIVAGMQQVSTDLLVEVG